MARRSTARTSPREQLLDRALEHVLRHGIGDGSLRAIAPALGTSHRMLIYHFGSAEAFWHQVVARVRERDLRAAGEAAERGELPTLQETWAELSTERYLPIARLMFEIYGPALRDRARYAGFLSQIVDSWVETLAAALEAQCGATPAEARVHARLRLAVIRGLLLDLLTTGDREGTTAALELFANAVQPPRRRRKDREGKAGMDHRR